MSLVTTTFMVFAGWWTSKSDNNQRIYFETLSRPKEVIRTESNQYERPNHESFPHLQSDSRACYDRNVRDPSRKSERGNQHLLPL